MEQEPARSKLVRVASVDVYESQTLDRYRRDVADSLRGILEASQEVVDDVSSSVSSSSAAALVVLHRYNVEYLESSLALIEWKTLCKHYDRTQDRGQAKDDGVVHSQNSSSASFPSASALEEILGCLRNPSLWPSACSQAVIKVLMRVFLLLGGTDLLFRATLRSSRNRGKHRWSPSRQLIVETVTSLTRQVPALRQVIVRQMCCELIPSAERIDGELYLLLSLLKKFVKNLSSGDPFLFVPCLLGHLARLDELYDDDSSGETARRRKQSVLLAPPDDDCSTRKRKRPASSSLEMLHGEVSDDETTQQQSYDDFATIRRQQRHRMKSSGFSMKRLVNSAGCPRHNESSSQQKLASLRRLRTKCIKLFLSVAAKSKNLSSRQLDIVLLTDPRVWRSPSVRLCMLLLADNYGERGYQFLCQRLWYLAMASDVNASSFLSLYSETISECSFFDNIERCWEAIQPLILELKFFCDNGTSCKTSMNVVRPFLYCFASLLPHRGGILALNATFVQLAAKLSLVFDEPDDWLEENMSEAQHEKILHALQVAGILGVCSDMNTSTREYLRSDESAPRQSFPLFRVRFVAKGIYLVRTDLFSLLSRVNGVPCLPSAKLSPSEPLMDRLNDDVLRRIFSFIGFKRLVQARLVSKQWKDVADSHTLWRRAYKRRYGTSRHDELAKIDKGIPWKLHFIDKFKTESLIDSRFNLNKNGEFFKVRVCSFVGCQHIIKSKHQLKRHYAKHSSDKAGRRRQRNGTSR